MNKKAIVFMTLLLVTSIILTACGPSATVAEDEWGNMVFAEGTKIKLAVSSALAGGYAVYGQDMLNGRPWRHRSDVLWFRLPGIGYLR
jgi:hypothetical protein